VGLPARRLTGEHVRGRDVFDGTYAGIEGALDAVHTDGEWRSGERASIRIAQEDLNLQPGDRLGVRVVHRPTGTTVDGTTVVAE
jgi:FlaG/FlaF family flagellin (archaellin)